MALVKRTFVLACVLALVAGCTSSSPPLASGESPYDYEDGLTRSTPEAQGVPSAAILRFFQKIEENDYDVHGFMMLRHGKVIAEHWWAPYAPQYQHANYSATKTFTATAIGFAVQEGLLSVDDKVVSFFPELLPDTISPQLAELSVEHLLTMTVGHASTRYAGSGESQVRSFLSAPFAHEPGTVFAYDITASHMLSRIITKVSGVTILDFLKPRLFDPLGIEDVRWEMDSDGINMGNGGSHLRTSDLAKLGLLFLNGGVYNGQRLLSEEWIRAATTPHVYQHPEMTPEEREHADDDGSQGYGYQTWMGRHGSYRAAGAQSQLSIVIPKYDLVVAVHAQIADEAGFSNLIFEMLPSMSDETLDPDPSIDLNRAIAHYEIDRPFAHASAAKLTMSTRRYRMEDDPTGIDSVLFRFDASGDCHLTLVSDGEVHNLPFGLDHWLVGMTDRTPSFARSVYPNPMGVTPVRTAGICTWTDADHLSAYYQSMFNPGSTETFTFTFEGDRLRMEVVAPTGRRPGPPGMARPARKNLVSTGTKMEVAQ